MYKRYHLGIWLPFLMAFMLNACSPIATKTHQSGATNPVREAQLANIQYFSVQGRIGLQAEGRGYSGKFDWQHSPSQDVLSFYSPLGTKLAQIERHGLEALLTTNDQRTHRANSLSALTQEAIGWTLPVESMQDWILGRPASGAHAVQQWDDGGRLVRLTQQDWQIDYQEYNAAEPALPIRLSARNSKAYMKLIIHQWQLQAGKDNASE